jgi:protein pelota
LQVLKTEFSAASGGNAASAGNDPSPSLQPNSFASLQISGRVALENDHVKMGAYHTLDVEVGRDVRIVKEEWDSIALATVGEACVPGRGAEVGAIVCGEGLVKFLTPIFYGSDESTRLQQELQHSVFFRNI